MKYFQGLPRRTVIPMLVVLVVGQVSPLSWTSSTNTSNKSSVQAATTTISFQDGVSPKKSYRGTRDTMLSEDQPDKNFGTDSRLGIDGDEPPGTRNDRVVLLSWNLTDIPKYSSIESATITLHFDEKADNPTSKDRYTLYALKRDWNETQATWIKNRISSSWSRSGASSTNDRSYSIGSFVPSQGQEQTIELNSRGVSMVQTWVNDPAKNFGLIIASSTNTDGADFLSSEAPRGSDRPKLTVSYQSKESISKPPENNTRSSLFQDHNVSQAGVQATVYRSDNAYGGSAIQLKLNQIVRLPYDWSVVSIYRFNLGAFDRNDAIRYFTTNSNGKNSSSAVITPEQLKKYPTGVPLIFGMGEPSGKYTVTFTQGNQAAAVQFTVPDRVDPEMGIWPDCVSRGQQFTLYIAGLPKGIPLDVYRHDRNSDLGSYWKYVSSIPAPKVNERGEAIYYLKTRSNDPQDRYLIVARDQNTEVRFKLPCD